MKKTKYYVMTTVLAASMLITAGCGKKKAKEEANTASTTDAITEVTTEQSEIILDAAKNMRSPKNMNLTYKDGFVISELTGEWIDEKLEKQRPVAVMVNNIDDAIPQSGISGADIIYEMIAEGGITRLMCLFKDYENLPKLGSVRSARQYFVQVANMHNCIYAHIGYSKLGKKEIDSSGIDNLNGLTGAVSAITYYRDHTRYAPHNCYTDGPKIVEGIKVDGYSREYTKDNDKMYIFNTEDTKLNSGNVANKAVIGFRAAYKPYFEYNEEEGVYYRFEYGGPHIDEYTDTQLSFKNVVVIFAEYTTLTDGRNKVDFDKGGKGYYITDGEYMEIKWHKDNDVIKYYDNDGNIIKFNPGKTFVEVFKDSQPNDITFE